MRLARVSALGGKIMAYVQEGPPDYFATYSPSIDIAALSTSMQLLAWSPKSDEGMADLSAIARIGIELNGVGGSAFASPTIVDVDRIEISGVSALPRAAWDFDDSLSIFGEATTIGPVDRLWLNSSTYDTTVMGAAVLWMGP